MRSPKRISVVIALFNGADSLQKALDSVRYQKSDDVEFVIINGASKDATMDVVRRNEDIVDFVLSEPDTGIYNAWNKGLRAATGEWIAFIGSDAWYAPGALDAYRRAAERASADTDLISSKVRYHPLYGDPFVIGRAWSWPAFQRHMTIAHVGALHRRRPYERVGPYDERYRICGDYELLLRSRDALRAEFIDVVTAEISGAGISNNQLGRTFEESSRARREAGGRPAWRVQFERPWDHLRARLKRLSPSF